MSRSRLSALLAVERDPVRRRERLLDLRLAAAVLLAGRVEVCEALLAGVPVPAARLCPELAHSLQLEGQVVLDEALAIQVVGYGPLFSGSPSPRRRGVGPSFETAQRRKRS